VRAHVLALLRGGHAHATFAQATARVPRKLRGALPRRAEHTIWQLVEHIRLGQRDILDFSRNTTGTYRAPKWPEGYWPATAAPPSDRAWTASLRAIGTDLRALEKMVADPAHDLLTPFPWGDGQTLLRETLLVADHTAYHVGQIVVVRRILGAWPT
jgi:hypothetical protein